MTLCPYRLWYVCRAMSELKNALQKQCREQQVFTLLKIPTSKKNEVAGEFTCAIYEEI